MRRKLLVVLVLVGVVAILACSIGKDNARTRVSTMLDRWKSGGTGTGGDAQSASMLFFVGRAAPTDETEAAIASDRFEAWRKQKDLYRSISSFEVTSVEDDSATSDSVKVTVVIDGATYAIRAIPGQPLQWMD
jgi:hypothetical protein